MPSTPMPAGMLAAFAQSMMGAPKELPSKDVRDDITAKLTQLIAAFEAHPEWVPGRPAQSNRGLFHVWDFVTRTKYIMTELDNIREGKPLQWPDQIPRNSGAASPNESAVLSFQDVCTRAYTVDEMIREPRMLVMLGLSQVDFGDHIRNASKAVVEAVKRSSS